MSLKGSSAEYEGDSRADDCGKAAVLAAVALSEIEKSSGLEVCQILLSRSLSHMRIPVSE